MMSRRNLMGGGAAALGAAAAAVFVPRSAAGDTRLAPSAVPALPGRTVPLDLDIAERSLALPCFGGRALPLLTFNRQDYPLVARCRLGDTIEARVKNGLTRAGEHVTIHWHGLRIANGQDGVPFLTQAPIQPGIEGRFTFAPPDTGTYFFHTHCNSVEHFGRGLVGVLVVEGDETAPFADDIVLMMKDWRLDEAGQFLPFTTDTGAAKGGTPGTVRSINGITAPRFAVTPGAPIRLRVLNVDATRLSEIGIAGAAARVIAVDGNACEPFPLKSWRMGSAMRLDIEVATPQVSAEFQLLDYFAPVPVTLATFATRARGAPAAPIMAPPLRRPRIAEPDLRAAQRLTFDFSATATGEAVADLAVDGVPVGPLCLSSKTFWAINKRSWATMREANSGPPLAELRSGQSYIFELVNRTPRAHPIHIHGHTFKWLQSNLRTLPPHFADTVLLLAKERIEVAVVAGEPGQWMFHCHLLEHQETGMMGYMRVVR